MLSRVFVDKMSEVLGWWGHVCLKGDTKQNNSKDTKGSGISEKDIN